MRSFPDIFVRTLFWTLTCGVVLESSFGQMCQYPLSDSFDSGQWGFGQAVDVRSDLLLIGAPSLDSGTNGSRAFLFRVSDGALIQSLEDPSNIDSFWFGSSVAISPDSTQVLIGDPGDDTLANAAGQAYLFDASSGNLEMTFNMPIEDTGPDFGGNFGASVAISDEYVVVGATSVESFGRVYLFDRKSGQMIDSFDDPDPTGGDLSGLRDLFGAAVAIRSNLLVIGSPADATQGAFAGDAHIFDIDTGNRLETMRSPILDPGMFGGSLDISDDYIAVGARSGGVEFSLGPGVVHVFDAGSFQYLHSIDAPDPGSFGVSVALYGGRLVAGAHLVDTNLQNEGQAYVFDVATQDLIQTLNDPTSVPDDCFGYAVATDGISIAVGSGEFLSGQPGDAHLFHLKFDLADVNRDGDVNLLDVAEFVDHLSSGKYQCEADINGDQSVDLLDVAGFVVALL